MSGHAEKYSPYDEPLQQKLEEAYQVHLENACIPMRIKGHTYIVKFTTVCTRESGEITSQHPEGWVQLRADDETRWRAVQRVRTSPSARASAMPSYPLASTRHVEFDYDPGKTTIGALTGFAYIAKLAPPELVKRCLLELPSDAEPSRGSRPQYKQQSAGRPNVWHYEPGQMHKDFDTLVTLPEATKFRAWAMDRARRIGGRFESGCDFNVTPPAWMELDSLLRAALVLTGKSINSVLPGNDGSAASAPPGNDGSAASAPPLRLLDDMLLLHCQASRVRAGGKIHPHVDKALYGELICTVLLQGASAVRVSSKHNLEVERHLDLGDAYCLFGRARSHEDATPKWQHGVAYAGGETEPREPRYTLTFRYAPRSAFELSSFAPVRAPSSALAVSVRAGDLVDATVRGISSRFPGAYPALVLGGPEELGLLMEKQRGAWPTTSAVAAALSRELDISRDAEQKVREHEKEGEACALIVYLQTSWLATASPAFHEQVFEVVPCADLLVLREDSIVRAYMMHEKDISRDDGVLGTNNISKAQEAARRWATALGNRGQAHQGGLSNAALLDDIRRWAANGAPLVDRYLASGGELSDVEAVLREHQLLGGASTTSTTVTNGNGPSMKPPVDADVAPARICKGASVILIGLIKRSDLNGSTATVWAYHPPKSDPRDERERWSVQLPLSSEKIKVRPENLRMAAAAVMEVEVESGDEGMADSQLQQAHMNVADEDAAEPAAAMLPAPPPASNEVRSLQGNPGMGPSSSHPRGAAEAAPRRQAITTSSTAKASSTVAQEAGEEAEAGAPEANAGEGQVALLALRKQDDEEDEDEDEDEDVPWPEWLDQHTLAELLQIEGIAPVKGSGIPDRLFREEIIKKAFPGQSEADFRLAMRAVTAAKKHASWNSSELMRHYRALTVKTTADRVENALRKRFASENDGARVKRKRG